MMHLVCHVCYWQHRAVQLSYRSWSRASRLQPVVSVAWRTTLGRWRNETRERHLMSYLRASSASRVLLLATRHAKHHAVSVRTDLYRHSSSIQRLLCLFRPGTAYAHTAGENRQVYIFITRFTTPTSIFLMLSGSTTLSSTQLKVAL